MDSDKRLYLYYPSREIKTALKKRAVENRLSVSKYLLLCSTFYEQYKKAIQSNV